MGDCPQGGKSVERMCSPTHSAQVYGNELQAVVTVVGCWHEHTRCITYRWKNGFGRSQIAPVRSEGISTGHFLVDEQVNQVCGPSPST